MLQIAESFGWGPPQDYSVDLDEDGGIGTLDELQARVAHLQDSHLIG